MTPECGCACVRDSRPRNTSCKQCGKLSIVRLPVCLLCVGALLRAGPASAGLPGTSLFSATHVIQAFARQGVRVHDVADSQPTCPTGKTCGVAIGALNPPRV